MSSARYEFICRFRDARIEQYVKDHGGRGGDVSVTAIIERLLIKELFGADDHETIIKEHRRRIDAKRAVLKVAQNIYERHEEELAEIEVEAGRQLGVPLIRAEEALRLRLLREAEDRKERAQAAIDEQWARTVPGYREAVKAGDNIDIDEWAKHRSEALRDAGLRITAPQLLAMMREGRKPEGVR